MNAYYKERKTEITEFMFLNLTADVNWSLDRSDFYTFEKNGEVSNRGILTLPEDKEKNMNPFQISTYSIPIFSKILTETLDQDFFQEFLVHGIQYPAQKLTSDFDKQRDEGRKYHLPFYKYLRESFLPLIQEHQKTKLSRNDTEAV
jgi:hypothetical protein